MHSSGHRTAARRCRSWQRQLVPLDFLQPCPSLNNPVLIQFVSFALLHPFTGVIPFDRLAGADRLPVHSLLAVGTLRRTSHQVLLNNKWRPRELWADPHSGAVSFFVLGVVLSLNICGAGYLNELETLSVSPREDSVIYFTRHLRAGLHLS